MALSLGGLGSGIDTAALVATLMDAERMPQNRIKTLQDAAQRRITAWNELRTRTATVQGAAEALATPTKALGATATSTDATTLRVTAGDGATPTQLSVKVLSVATAEQSKVSGLTPGMRVGAGTTVLQAGLLPGSGLSDVVYSDDAADGVHRLSVTSASAPALAHGHLVTSLGATDLTVTEGGVTRALTLASSYATTDDLVTDLRAKLGSGYTVAPVGGRLEVRTTGEGSAAAFTLGGGAAAVLGLPTTAVTGRPAVVTVDGVRKDVEPAAAGGTRTVDLGGGTSITVGGALRAATVTSNVVRTTDTDTLADLQAKTNVSGSPLTATTLLDGDTATLVLTARDTGTAGAVTLPDGGLPLLLGRTTVTAATDASLSLGTGLTVTRSSNRITDLVPGVTLDLLRPTAPGADPVGVQVARDSTTTSTKAKALVDAMNALVSSVATLTKYDPATKTGGPLTGDSTARELSRSLFSKAATVTGSGTVGTLSRLGIETTRDGTFVFKPEVLKTALEASPDDVAAVLAQLGAAVSDYTKDMGKTGGRITQSRDGAQADVAARQKQFDAMDRRLQQTEKRLRAQYAALESAMGQLSARGSSLSAALSGMSGGG